MRDHKECEVTRAWKPSNGLTNSRRIKSFAFACVGTGAIVNRATSFVHGWSHDFLLMRSRRRPRSTPARQIASFLGRPHDERFDASVLYASSWGDEGEFACNDFSSDETVGDTSVDIAKPPGGHGRVRRVGKRIALVSAAGLSILGQGYAQSIAGSLLAIAAGFKASNLMAQNQQTNSSKVDEEQPKSSKRDAARRWLTATMGNLERIDEEIAEERRLEKERQEAQRIERGKEWARQSLQTTNELKRRADEARREERRARKWADDMIQQDMERQRKTDMERFGGKRFGGDGT